MANTVIGPQSRALQNYADAAKLAHDSSNTSESSSKHPISEKQPSNFKSELSHINSSILGGIKKAGAATEQHLFAQVMGNGNVGNAATSLQELNTHFEIVSQALRIMTEKITELTTRTMGG